MVNTVVALHAPAQNDVDRAIQNLRTTITHTHWTITQDAIAQAAGLRGSRKLLAEAETVLPNGSLARNLGFETVGEFITAPVVKGGLAFEWEKWVEQLKARDLADTYGISADAPEDVMLAVANVRDHLGRMPTTAEEYHATRSNILINRERDARIAAQEALAAHKLEMVTQRERLETEHQKALAEMEAAAKAELDQALNALRQALELEKSKALEEQRSLSEQQLQNTITALRIELSHEREEAIVLARQKSEAEIAELKAELAWLRQQVPSAEIMAQINNVQEILDRQKELQLHYARALDLLRRYKSNREDLLVEMRSMKRQNRDLGMKLKTAEKKIASLAKRLKLALAGTKTAEAAAQTAEKEAEIGRKKITILTIGLVVISVVALILAGVALS